MRDTFGKIERFLKERDVRTVLLAHDDAKTAAETQELVKDCRVRVNRVEESMVHHLKENPGISFAILCDKCCYQRNAKLLFDARLTCDASDAGLYISPTYRRRRRDA